VDGDYIYSGEGKVGDQTMTSGNRAILSAAEDRKAIHLFVKFSPQEYYYQGVFELADHTCEDDMDESRNIRKYILH
jgi:5-methylcytosine-specific restriction protein A